MITTTLYNIIRSELIKEGFNEFVNDQGELVIFNEEDQFLTKILTYDEDVKKIVNKLFTDQSLNDPENDDHFKKTFLVRFLNRQINAQTIDMFRVQLFNTFLTNEVYINTVYKDLEKYINQTQENNSTSKQENDQLNDGTTTSDNRQAYADLPQNNVQLDVNDTVMKSASDNTISRNKQTNKQETSGITENESESMSKSYHLNELFKSNGIMEQVFNLFDVKCFLQVW